MSNKVLIIGAGNVGAALTFSIAANHQELETTVVARNPNTAYAAALDAAGAFPMANISHSDSIDSDFDVAVITAGVQHSPDLAKLDMLKENFEIVSSSIEGLNLNNKSIVVIGSPVDDLALLTQKRFPEANIIGFGGQLDRNRLLYTLDKFDIKSANNFVIGEHGKRAIPVYDSEEKFTEVKNKVGNFLFEVKAATPSARNLATGHNLAELTGLISNKKSQIIHLNAFHPDFEQWLTWPWVFENGLLTRPLDLELQPKAKSSLDELLDTKSKEQESILDLLN